MHIRTLLGTALLTLAVAAPSQALEFRLDGYDRVRAQMYTGLSLTTQDDDPMAEGTRLLFMHRLRLEPHLRINPHMDVFAEADLFDNALFGGVGAQKVGGTLGANGESWAAPPALVGTVQPGTGMATGLIRRAWMDVRFGKIPLRFRAGRMPNHWGMGAVYNDGNSWDADYGDSVDRIELGLVYKNVRARLALDTWTEDFVNLADDVHGVTASVGYLGEVWGAGLLFEHRFSNKDVADPFQASLVDLWGRARLGPLALELEAALTFGKGSIPDSGFEEVQLLVGGGLFRGTFDFDPLRGGLEIGLATGDKDASDEKIGAFTIDPDHDVGFLLFEQAMPVFMVDPAQRDGVNGNVDQSQVITREGISNAFTLSPFVGYSPYDSLNMMLRFNVGWAIVKNATTGEQRGYGFEPVFESTWTLFESFELGARAALFVPGKIFPETNRRPLFGGEIRAIIRFD